MYSFETAVPNEWNQVTNGTLSISKTRFKDSLSSLKWAWQPGSVVTVTNPQNLSLVNPATGGLYFWLYNESPQQDSLKVEFLNVNNAVACSFRMYLNFKGWRCAWVSFKGDMKYTSSTKLGTMKIYAPAKKTGLGSLYFDLFDVQNSVLWSRTSDFFVKVNSSVEDDYTTPRKVVQVMQPVNLADTVELKRVEVKLDKWMMDTSRVTPDVNSYQNKRINDVQARIGYTKNRSFSPLWHLKFIRNADDSTVTAIDTVTGIGKGLFPTSSADSPRINEFASGACLQLALDYRINNNLNSLKRCIDLFDWMYDQGWADSSAMGSLYLQQVRTTAWPQAFFLLRNVLPEATYRNTLNAIYWHTQFGDSYLTYSPDMASANADFIRGLGVAKLIYALCVKDPQQRLSTFKVITTFLNKTCLPYAGFSDIYKPDYSTYHHAGAYVSEYGDDALHQSSLIYYLLDGTKFSLSETAYNQLRNTWLRYDFFSTNLAVPFAISGRGPSSSSSMQEHMQAFPYLALTQKGATDTTLIATFKRIINVAPSKVNSALSNAGIGISYTNSIGGAKGVVSLLNNPIPANADPSGAVYMPYSGMFFGRNKGWLVGARGFSKYIYDYEVIRTDGIFSRYLSYGSVQISSSLYKNDNFSPDSSYDWIHMPATTAKLLPLATIDASNSSAYWRFSDQTFLGGLKLNDSTGAFSVNLHDITYDTSFRAKKTMFYFGDMLYFMGSGITCKDATNPIHTTLFQNKRTTGLTKLLVNNQDVTNVGYTTSAANATTVIQDGLNNVYVVYPNTAHGISVQKQIQNGFSANGTATPAKEYDIAYLNHGSAISNELYRYAILLQPQQDAVNQMASDTLVTVLQQDANAHIAYHKTRKTFGFSFFTKLSNVNKGIIKDVYHPCIVMQQNINDSSILISFTDPDLRSPNYNKNNTKTDSLDIFGIYSMQNSSDPGISINYIGNGTTRIYFPTREGFDYRLQLTRTELKPIAFKPGNLAIVRVGTAISTGAAVNIDEYTPNGDFVRTVFIDSVFQPTANTSTEEGYLTLSGNGEYLGLTGYERTAAQGLYASRFDTVRRVAAFVRCDGSVVRRAIMPDLDLLKRFCPKSLYTFDGTDFWLGYGHLSGDYGGLMYGSMANTTNPIPLKSVTNWKSGFSVRQMNINPADKSVYFGTGTSKLNYFSNNVLPKDSANTSAFLTQLPITARSGVKGFCFLVKDSIQLMYLAITSNTGAGIIKYRKNILTNTWDSVGTYGSATDNYFSITAAAVGSAIELYAIRKSVNSNSKSELVAVTDEWLGNMTTSFENILIAANSPASQIFRGISVVPTFNNGSLLPIKPKPLPPPVNSVNVGLRIRPNPADNQIQVLYDKVTDKQTLLQICSVSGVPLKQINLAMGTSKIIVDIANLSSGIYSVKVVTLFKVTSCTFIKR